MTFGKVKNPCKVCVKSVSNKNGLQCKGACKKWFHYKCLNFSPGKISDVKAGIIKITCPCPDCITTEPNEDPSYLCTNPECPATLPSCESDWPSKKKPIPPFEPPNSTPPKGCPKLSKPQKCGSPPVISPKCSTPSISSTPSIPVCPPKLSSPPRKCSPSSKPNPKRQPYCERGRSPSPPKTPCPSCPVHCPKKAPQPPKLCSPQKSQSCSFISSKSSGSGQPCSEPPRASSHCCLTDAQKMVCNTIEEMFNTVGQLSNQLKNLMCKMKSAFESGK